MIWLYLANRRGHKKSASPGGIRSTPTSQTLHQQVKMALIPL